MYLKIVKIQKKKKLLKKNLLKKVNKITK